MASQQAPDRDPVVLAFQVLGLQMVLLHFSVGYRGSKFRSLRLHNKHRIDCAILGDALGSFTSAVDRNSLNVWWGWLPFTSHRSASELQSSADLSSLTPLLWAVSLVRISKGKTTKCPGFLKPVLGSSSLHHVRSRGRTLGIERNFTGHPNWGSCLLPYSSSFFCYISKMIIHQWSL